MEHHPLRYKDIQSVIQLLNQMHVIHILYIVLVKSLAPWYAALTDRTIYEI